MSCVGLALNNFVTFQHLVMTQDEIGGYTSSYVDYYSCFVNIKPVKSYQKWQAEKLSLKVSHRITCRYFDGIKSDDRIMYNNRIFEVQEVINVDEANRFYEIIASEGEES